MLRNWLGVARNQMIWGVRIGWLIRTVLILFRHMQMMMARGIWPARNIIMRIQTRCSKKAYLIAND
ncbi:hypothetical protein SAMN04487897_102870 [Paenibacillus sp. yr247]|nr:hypothetical protein SAMN04487897_102870 [Paenibacillus sp. yr247]